MTTYELIATCNIDWDLCRVVEKRTGQITKTGLKRLWIFTKNTRGVYTV